MLSPQENIAISTSGFTALFCPANRPDRMEKALNSPSQLVILDLEDAVADNDKDEARDQMVSFVQRYRGRPGLCVRINPLDTATGQLDFDAICSILATDSSQNPVVVIPKANESILPDTAGLPQPKLLRFIALIESVEGLRSLETIATHPHVGRLAFGGIDMSVELGCSVDSRTIDFVRAHLVIASVRHELEAPLDSPCPDFRNLEKVALEAKKAVDDGFGGMLCIHPHQVSTVQEVFFPSDSEIEWAKAVIELGDGAAQLNGEMVDRPVLLRAKNILSAVDSQRADGRI